jgi:hypothetical protein
VAVNCKAEVDGPFYYVDERSGEIVAACGGLCEARNCDLSKCPPKEWTCATNAARNEIIEKTCGSIIAPRPGLVVTSGSEVEVRIDLEGQRWDSLEFVADEGGAGTTINTVTGTGTVKIPLESSGPMRFALLGLRGNSTICESSPVELLARPASSITELFVMPKRATLQEGETKQLLVSAIFDDGVDRSALSSVVGTTYRSADSSIAIVDVNGKITARRSGITTINVTNGTLFQNITVQVLERQDDGRSD